MNTIKSLQEQFGISTEHKPTERTSLNKLRQQVAGEPCSESGPNYITDPAEIKDILDHILWRLAADCPTSNDSFPWENNYYRAFNSRFFTVEPREYYDILPEENDTTVADLLAVADWFSTNFKGEYKTIGYSHGIIERQEYAFARSLWSLFYNMAAKDSYFSRLRRVSVKSLIEFLRYRDGFCQDIPDIYWGHNDSKPVYEFYENITLGYMLDAIGERFKSWDPGEESIEKYKESVYYGCRTMQSIIHAICTAYFDVDARIAFLKECASDWDKRSELLARERKYREALKEPRLAV